MKELGHLNRSGAISTKIVIEKSSNVFFKAQSLHLGGNTQLDATTGRDEGTPQPVCLKSEPLRTSGGTINRRID